MDIFVKNLINVFTIIDGKINLLVNNNKLIEVECLDEFDIVNKNFIENNINIKDLDLKQSYTFCKKQENKLVLTVLYIDIVNLNNIELNSEFSFVELDSLDKNNIYLNKSIEYLKQLIVLSDTMKKLYPEEFVLPEIQKIYEQLLEKKIDRRNFRKKLIKLDIIEDLNKISSGKNGRPAKIYRFKNLEGKKILL